MPYSVLIVDDEMLIREGLRRHLDWATLDMEVIGVADGAESALEIARRRAPDILITDICMRSKTVFDLIEDLLELGLSPQVILISSYNDFSYAQRAVRLNVVREYILKPVDTDALTALLHKLRGELDLRPAHRRAEEDGGDLYLINGNMLPLKNAGAFANTPTDDGKEEKTNEEVLELEEPDRGSGTDVVPERHHRRGKLV